MDPDLRGLQSEAERIFEDLARRRQAAREAGGIPMSDVIDRTATIPKDWNFNVELQYYLPPGVVIE